MDTPPQAKRPRAAPRARRRRPASTNAPSPEARAAHLLFRKEAVRSLLDWLGRLGIASADRPDLAQEVLLAAYTSLPRYNPALAPPRRWMNRIAVHVAAHHHERGRRMREVLAAAPEFVGDASGLAIADERPGAEELLGGEERRRLVRAWIQALAPAHRSILLERHLEELPMAEIAERRGIPLSTAYKRHACALAAFMKIASAGAPR